MPISRRWIEAEANLWADVGSLSRHVYETRPRPVTTLLSVRRTLA